MNRDLDPQPSQGPGVLEDDLDATIEGSAGQKIGDSQATIPSGGRVR